MLALSRKKGQSVVIELEGVELVVEVLSIGRMRVRLGIVAPKNVGILRGELLALPKVPYGTPALDRMEAREAPERLPERLPEAVEQA